MIWQSWGHSDSTPAPGELDFAAGSLRDSYLGNRFLNWMNHYVHGHAAAPRRLRGSRTSATGSPTTSARRTPAPRSARPTPSATFSTRTPTAHAVPHRQRRARRREGRTSRPGRPPTPAPADAHVVLRDLRPRGQHGQPPAQRRPRHLRRVHHPPARRARRPGRVVRADAAPDAPTAAATQGGGPGGQLVLFAKLYDVAPDGTQMLHEPADLAGPGRRRDQAGDGARCRASCTGSRPVTGSGWRSRPATPPTRATPRRSR